MPEKSAPAAENYDHLRFSCKYPGHRRETIFRVPRYWTVEDAMFTRPEKSQYRNLQYFRFKGDQVDPDRTLDSLNLKEGDQIVASGIDLNEEEPRDIMFITYQGPAPKVHYPPSDSSSGRSVPSLAD
ncbi:hypothetical protein FQN53_009656 [Emmonsiellopsis sp. PD_33]|nr:hypothetical protein FQN53_009656 [Emmonsiellopsis sp. PD_33]